MNFRKQLERILTNYNEVVKCAFFVPETGDDIILPLAHNKEEYKEFVDKCHEGFESGNFADITIWYYSEAYSRLDVGDDAYLRLSYHKTPQIPKQLYPKK